MKETPQEYIQRMLGNIQGQEPLKVQAATAWCDNEFTEGKSASTS